MVNKISVGSDPEFVIINGSGKVISAEELFGKCGKCYSRDHDEDACEDCEEQDRLYKAEIGCDGNSTIGELRPQFEFSPLEHHANIKDLISQIDIAEVYQIRAGTRVDGLSIGGHIHLGNSKLGTSNFSKYISKYAGILLRKIEHPEDLLRRGLADSSYGQFGAHNLTSYGIEWRMPASWLVSSDIALSALCLARVVANEYIVNPPTKIIKMPKIEEQIKTISSTYMTTRLIHNIERMDEYNKYSKELEPLFQLLINKKKWVTKVDIRTRW